jgi:hypothetical protein
LTQKNTGQRRQEASFSQEARCYQCSNDTETENSRFIKVAKSPCRSYPPEEALIPAGPDIHSLALGAGDRRQRLVLSFGFAPLFRREDTHLKTIAAIQTTVATSIWHVLLLQKQCSNIARP